MSTNQVPAYLLNLQGTYIIVRRSEIQGQYLLYHPGPAQVAGLLFVESRRGRYFATRPTDRPTEYLTDTGRWMEYTHSEWVCQIDEAKLPNGQYFKGGWYYDAAVQFVGWPHGSRSKTKLRVKASSGMTRAVLRQQALLSGGTHPSALSVEERIGPEAAWQRISAVLRREGWEVMDEDHAGGFAYGEVDVAALELVGAEKPNLK